MGLKVEEKHARRGKGVCALAAAKNIHQEKTMCLRKMLQIVAPWGFFGEDKRCWLFLAFCDHSVSKVILFIS